MRGAPPPVIIGSMTKLAPGLRGTAERVVTERLTARKLRSGTVPVLGTPALLAMIEDAAVVTVSAALEPGSTSVGVWVELEHLAASRVGARVTATAELTGVDGRALEFWCEAHEGEKLIGRARHRRTIVEVERFLARA